MEGSIVITSETESKDSWEVQIHLSFDEHQRIVYYKLYKMMDSLANRRLQDEFNSHGLEAIYYLLFRLFKYVS